MENKNIIMILLVVIVILLIAIGVMFFNPINAKEPCKIKITSDKEQYEGGELSMKLTDLHKTPMSKEIVNVTITNKKGKVVVDEVIKTDSKGKAKLDLDLKKGKYTVNVTYDGNENYTGNNTTQKLKIKEEVVEASVSESSSQGSSSHLIMGEDGYYYTVDDNGNILQNLGPSSKHYSNGVYYSNAEPGDRYIDKSK